MARGEGGGHLLEQAVEFLETLCQGHIADQIVGWIERSSRSTLTTTG
jgi:hypothetical protein